MNKGRFKLCLVTAPLPEIQGVHILVENFLHLLEPLTEKIYLITGNYPQNAVFSPKIHLTNVKHDSKKQSVVLRTFKHILIQLKICYHLLKIANRVETVIFFIGTALLLPMVTAKLLRKRTLLIATGSTAKGAQYTYRKTFCGVGSWVFSYTLRTLEESNRILSDRIVALSDGLVHELGLSRYRHKIDFNCATFVDVDHFKIETDAQQKKNMIGYIGRISEAKGIRNFVRAISLLPPKCDAQFLIGGDGSLLNEIKDEVKSNGLDDRVVFTGWIPHEALPDYLSELRLLVVPSYTEVFATIALEAMACGTPVLVTPIGSATDIIKDGGNGFIMENNSPECIAENIERVLNYPDIEKVVRNARDLVEKEFSYQTVMDGYREILKEGHD